MKPYIIPMILLSAVIIVLAGSLIYFLTSESQTQNVSVPAGTGTQTQVNTLTKDFSCSLSKYANTDACLYPNPQIKEVKLPEDLKTDLPQVITLTLYNAGKSTTKGYEVRQFYFDEKSGAQVQIGGITVDGIHNSGQTKQITMTWVPAQSGRYKYLIKLYNLEQAGVPAVILEKGMTSWASYVNVKKSEMACHVTLADKDTIKIEESEKCTIVKSSKIIGIQGNNGYIDLPIGTSSQADTESIYTLIGDHVVSYEGSWSSQGMQNLRFRIDKKLVETKSMRIGDRTNLIYEDLDCEILFSTSSIARIIKSPKCNIKSSTQVAGRTDIIVEAIMNLYDRKVALDAGMYTIINQEMVRLKDLVLDNSYQTFYGIFEVDGETIQSDEVKYTSISVFGK